MRKQALTLHYPTGFGQFACIGSDCELTCCAGWHIAIDRAAEKCYRRAIHKNNTAGGDDFVRRLHSAVDWSAHSFKTVQGHCAMLNKDGLCDIYIHMGEEQLCRTCRTYPRHMEDYGSVHEIMLLLSCPEAARHVLLTKKPLEIRTTMRLRHPSAVGIDSEALGALLDIRGYMFDILYERSVPLKRRLSAVLAMGHDLERGWYDHGQDPSRGSRLASHYRSWYLTAKFDERLQKLLFEETTGFHKNATAAAASTVLTPFMAQVLTMLSSLEVVTPEWPKLLQDSLWALRKASDSVDTAAGILSEMRHGHTAPASLAFALQAFEQYTNAHAYIYENLAAYYLYMYLPGALYDGALYSKIKLALINTLIIKHLHKACYLEQSALASENSPKIETIPETQSTAALIRIIALYSRQLDHSDPNLETLEHILSNHKIFSLKNLMTEINKSI